MLRDAIRQRYALHPGRGGCGVGAVADMKGGPSREVIDLALQGLGCLEHRGGAIEDTGDGAGLLISTDRAFFEPFIAPNRRLPEGHALAVGVLFFPFGEAANLPHYQREIDAKLRRTGLAPLGWRHVPVDASVLGARALQSRRDVWQVLIGEGHVAHEDLRKTLYRVKAEIERDVRDVYVASLAPDTIVYKALATGEQLRRFYLDLENPAFGAKVCVFHRRYSTNTFSNWYLAQVFRTMCHNGEINTIKANRNAVENLGAELGLGPILMPQGSDSADMDRLIDFFVAHDISLPEALCRIMPAAWRDVPDLPPETGRFFRGVQRALGSLGAWEGPAAVVATDGRYLVGALDRMGLRPLRYVVTSDAKFFLSSEIGAVPIPFDRITETGQLDPGEAIALDLRSGQLLRNEELFARVLEETPINFGELSEHRLVSLGKGGGRAGDSKPPGAKADLSALNLFGWTTARVRALEAMAELGKEPITSMGFDRPLPVLSSQRPPLAKYLKQIVAVVTNPPIDPLREGGAFDLTVHLGAAPMVHENLPVYEPLPQYAMASPFLTEEQMRTIRSADSPVRPRAATLDCSFDDPGNGLTTGAKALSRKIADICRQAIAILKKEQATILILSDREATTSARLPVPMVLMVSALHNALVAEGRRRHASLVLETGEVQEGHDAAVLIGCGADAILPYLFYEVGRTKGSLENLHAALDETLKRVMSKMGICSVDGYRGSRLFEAVGLAPALVEHYLPGVASRIGGLELEHVYDDLRARKALGQTVVREADVAVYRKEVWNELQTTARGHDPASYGRFLKLIAETPPVYLRDMMTFREVEAPVAIEGVAEDHEIVAACFRGAAMSHGALHRVAHRAIAAAFNELGASSNCGEGGEDPRRDSGAEWEASRSRIRQIASGRFGVDARYLAHADEISIKIGQGAKPGEGGMLPAGKVTAEVAMIRKTQVGVALISPPPHHDIYSIEDLAQLVHDLRQVNPRARVSVKIPAVTDIGTIAVGIAKAGADVIDVSGFEGGTGAAAASSIEHAGLPLERALSETHQALVINGIRERVRLRADGGIKTGFDVAAVLALGADEVSLGTALMVAESCIFCHGCANGLCPAGITTQSELVARRLMTVKKGRGADEKLPDDEDARYLDAKEAVKRYLVALAGDLRGHLARLGLTHPRELVGRVDLLEQKRTGDARKDTIDLAELLTDVGGEGAWRKPHVPLQIDRTTPLNARLVAEAKAGALEIRAEVASGDRAIAATLAGAIALGDVVPKGEIKLALHGYAGQALGFALTDSMRIELDGFANDVVGEAMGGGVIVVRAPRDLDGAARVGRSAIGNAACYGATGGALFVEGRAGQRVGVRNSGGTIVVEGAGKYAFEYMTGGVGVVLGEVGPVVCSGMTGGTVYLYDVKDPRAIVHKDGRPGPLEDADAEALRALVERHAKETGSAIATAILADWPAAVKRFVKVVPAGLG